MIFLYIVLDSDEYDSSTPFEDQYIEVLEEDENDIAYDDESMLFLESKKGITILHYNGFKYVRAHRLKNGTRWKCATNELCEAFLYLNDQNDIVVSKSEQEHDHRRQLADVDSEESDTAIVITSRKGKEMLLFRKYTYRKQYDKGNRCRWVCSTMKNCRGCVFTDSDNYITSAFEQHCHDPPKYYLNPDHVLDALREPLTE